MSLTAILTTKELKVFTMLAHGYSYSEISERLSISRCSLYSHTNNIRNKLDISSTMNSKVCAEVFTTLQQKRTEPTPRQMRIFRMLVAGLKPAEIAKALQLSPQTVHNATYEGRERAGITTTRIAEIRQYLRGIDGLTIPPQSPMDDPMF